MESTLREKAEQRVEALRTQLAEEDAKLVEAHRAFLAQQAKAYTIGCRFRDAERLALSFVGTAQATPLGQAAVDLSMEKAKSNVAEFGPAASIMHAGQELLDAEERRAAFEANEEALKALRESEERA